MSSATRSGACTAPSSARARATRKTGTITHRRLTLAYDDAGTGRPLVLLHAFPLDRRMWQPQLGPLSAVARVVAVDLPGFGDSTPGGERFAIDTAADAVLDFLDTI